MKERIKELLKREGFVVVDYSDVKASIDIIAKRDGEVLVIRVLGSLDALKPEHAEDMAKLASLLEGRAIVVAERSRWGPLKHGTVYYRYGVPAMSPETFLDMLRGELPKYIYTKGREVAPIDEEALKRAREKKGLSLQRLAELVGTTKETIYRYERGQLPTRETAEKLEEVLGVSLIKGFVPVPREPDEVLHFPFSHLKKIGGRVSEFRRLPWSAMARRRLTITFLYGMDIRRAKRKLREVEKARGRVFNYYLYVGRAKGIMPYIEEEEIAEAKSFREIEKIARERSEE